MRYFLPLAAVFVAACASEADLFSRAPANRPVKVIVLAVEGDRSTLIASETVLFDVEHVPGVIAVSRGSGTNEVQCLVDMKVEAQEMVAALTPQYSVKVVRTVLREQLPPAGE